MNRHRTRHCNSKFLSITPKPCASRASGSWPTQDAELIFSGGLSMCMNYNTQMAGEEPTIDLTRVRRWRVVNVFLTASLP